jgi:phage shock protein A
MGLLDRISRLMRANVNDMVSKAEDPEKILEQAVIEMNDELVQLRQAVAGAIAEQKRSEQKYNKAIQDEASWQQKAQLALSKGDENLAKEALVRKRTSTDEANTFKNQLGIQTSQSESLKKTLRQLETKMAEAKAKKNMLQSRSKAAKAQEQLQGAMGKLGNSGSMAAFERMEEKVLQQEARSQAAYELAGSSLEDQFDQLSASSNVDDELEMMKQQMLGGAKPTQGALPGTATAPAAAATPAQPVDAEIEELRKQIDKL